MFSKPNAIIYVRRSGLVVAGKRLAPARMNFDAEQFVDMEVWNRPAFIDACQQFFNEHGLRGKHILMVFDDSLVFSKSTGATTPKEAQTIREDFIAAMPLDPGKRAIVTTRTQEQLDIYATNAEIYGALAEAIRAAGAGRLLAITPAAAYGASADVKLSAAIQTFINDTSVHTATNFASADVV